MVLAWTMAFSRVSRASRSVDHGIIWSVMVSLVPLAEMMLYAMRQ